MRARALLAGAAALAIGSGLLSGIPGADAAPAFADVDEATIRPGAEMVTEGSACTANFVFADGIDVYLGYAAHCAGTGAQTETDGCTSGTRPLGTEVSIEGAEHDGVLAYSSWVTMQARGETDPNACAFNDFALVRLDPRDIGRVNPTMPVWGGPTGLNVGGIESGGDTYAYGSSSLRQGIDLISPQKGLALGTTGAGWSHPVYQLPPGIPGDSGSGMLDARGHATGVLSTLGLLPRPLSNGFSDVGSALRYMQAAVPALAGVALVPGTEPFTPNALPLDLG